MQAVEINKGSAVLDRQASCTAMIKVGGSEKMVKKASASAYMKTLCSSQRLTPLTTMVICGNSMPTH